MLSRLGQGPARLAGPTARPRTAPASAPAAQTARQQSHTRGSPGPAAPASVSVKTSGASRAASSNGETRHRLRTGAAVSPPAGIVLLADNRAATVTNRLPHADR